MLGTMNDVAFCWIVKLLLYSATNLVSVRSFNLDSAVPIIKSGPTSSYFGFSVAQHQVTDDSATSVRHLVIVGAPKYNRSDVTFAEPGSIFSCPFTAQTSGCTRLDIDKPNPTDDKSNQWLGVSVASQHTVSGKAIACAHRYTKRSSSYAWGLGVCFLLENTLEELDAYEPCSGKPTNRGHEQYGLCQAGTDATMDKAGNVLVGAPGPHNWKGTVFKNSVNFDDSGSFEGNTEAVVSSDSYLGMAVAIGQQVSANGDPVYFAGAPRSRGHGEVLAFRQADASKLELISRIPGQQFCSGFGHALTIGDFNGDGKEDLIVGAPFYHEPGVSGAIYIYFNSQTGLADRPIRITNRGTKGSESRFGHSLTTIGDLNQDGCQDFIVGAPFEGNGVIYVFNGSPNSKIATYSQRIAASDVSGAPSNFSSFGYSLSGGRDVDDNTYPDLAVGAYLSDTIVVLRSRPIVTVIATLASIPNRIDPKLQNCSNTKPFNCISIKVCLRFTAEPKDRYSGRLNINYRLETERFTGANVVRMFFGDNTDTYFVNKTLTMREQSTRNDECSDHYVYLKKNNKDFLSPVAFRLTYQLPDSRPPQMDAAHPLPDFYTYPVLNSATSSKELLVSFIKNCGTDDVCNSDLKLSADVRLDKEGSDYLLKLGIDDEVRLKVTVTNNGEDAHETVLRVTLPQYVSMNGVESEDNKLSCIPVDNVLECELGNPVAEKTTVDIVIRLNPNKIPSDINQINIGLEVNTTSSDRDSSDNHLSLSIRVATIVDLAVIGSSDPTTVYYDISGQQDLTPSKEDDIGPEITHKFEVKNVGKVSVKRSSLTITWPLRMTDTAKGYLLYIMEKPHVKGNSPGLEGARCSIDDNFVNPLRVQAKYSDVETITANGERNNDRKKRSSAEESGIGDMICGKSSDIFCITISCIVLELRPAESALISIRSRLWNKTLSSNFPEANELLLRSIAQISLIHGSHVRESDSANDFGQAVTKLASSTLKAKTTPLWIIILSACAGILLLVGLILLLWKCGFFRRKKPELLLEHTAEIRSSTEELEDQPTAN